MDFECTPQLKAVCDAIIAHATPQHAYKMLAQIDAFACMQHNWGIVWAWKEMSEHDRGLLLGAALHARAAANELAERHPDINTSAMHNLK